MADPQEIADWQAMLVPRKQENQTMRSIRWAGTSICGAIRDLPDGDPRIVCLTALYHLGTVYKYQCDAPNKGTNAPTEGETDG